MRKGSEDMKLYFYHFDCKRKVVECEAAEVIEKPKTYKPESGEFPFYPVSILAKADVNNPTLIRRTLCYVKTEENPIEAVRKFREYWGSRAEEMKHNAETFDDYYRSCFKYDMGDKGVMAVR